MGALLLFKGWKKVLRRKSRHLTRLGIKVPDVTNTLQLPSEATC